MIIRNVIIYIVLNILSLFCCLCAKSNPVDWVYPLFDTENSRWFYFSSASRTFGMVNLIPDGEQDIDITRIILKDLVIYMHGKCPGFQ